MASAEHSVELRIINAKNLVAMDTNGYSDPYVKVTLEGSKAKLRTNDKIYKTQVIKKTLNPEWNELCTFKIEDPESNYFKIDVYDQDRIGKDFIGTVILTLNDLEANLEKVEWHKLCNIEHGEIQLGIRPNFCTIKHRNVQNNNSPSYFYPSPYQPVPLNAPIWVDPNMNLVGSGFAPFPSYQQPYAPPQIQVPPSNIGYSNNNYGQSQGIPPDNLTHSTKVVLDSNAHALGFNITFNEIKFDKKIGVGGFGEVWKGEWAGTPVAIKKILKTDISEYDLQEFSKEIMLMSKLRHPNIVPFLGACVEPFCLLTEFMSKGCLFNVLEEESISMDWHLKLRIITDIAKGMVYLHTRNPPIIHRDIKSLNVLVASDWKCTIADFGLTKIKDKAMLQTKCGSPAWSAPEVLRGEAYNEKADVFSYGIVLWEVFSREHPYKGISPQQLIGLIGYQKPGLRPPIPTDCPSPALIELMVKCWDDDPHVRPDFTVLLEQLKAITLP